jgi:hypothetical protein
VDFNLGTVSWYCTTLSHRRGCVFNEAGTRATGAHMRGYAYSSIYVANAFEYISVLKYVHPREVAFLGTPTSCGSDVDTRSSMRCCLCAHVNSEPGSSTAGEALRTSMDPPGPAAPPRFLAFGDSLTAGYHSDGLAFSPYAGALASAIGCPTSAIDVCGASGLQATQLVHVLESQSERDVCGQEYSGLNVLCQRAAQSKQYEAALIMVTSPHSCSACRVAELTLLTVTAAGDKRPG